MKTTDDLTGRRFGRWMVIAVSSVIKYNEPTCLCKCDCGTERLVSCRRLLRGTSKSCGCLPLEKSVLRRIDLSGKIFGRLTVIKREGLKQHRHALWSCLCACGKTIVANMSSLVNGYTRSCGCLRREITRERSSGEKCRWWKGGITPINQKIKNSIEYRLWREAVYARDNWTCVECGKKGGEIHAHHIKRFSEYPEIRFAIDNGITLCVKCHKKTLTWGGNSKKLKIQGEQL